MAPVGLPLARGQVLPARPGPKGGSCRPAGRAQGRGKRPQATCSARVTRGRADIGYANHRAVLATDPRGAPRPVPLPRAARGARAGERPR